MVRWVSTVNVLNYDPDKGEINVVIPAWDDKEKFTISTSELPDEVVQALNEGKRQLFARVDVEADKVDDLNPDEWRVAESREVKKKA